MTTESYADALEKVRDYKFPDSGENVIRMIADGHAQVKFSPRGIYCIKILGDHYSIYLTSAGHATLRSHGRLRK